MVKIVANASLSEAIKQNDEIKGIQIPNTDREAKMFSHADDKTLILSDPTSIKETFEVFDLYGKVSGVKLNKSKSEILVLRRGKTVQGSMYFMCDFCWFFFLELVSVLYICFYCQTCYFLAIMFIISGMFCI